MSDYSNYMRFIVDPGHGWLEVDLHQYPDAENYGTGYGYLNEDEGFIYLEEDCEAPAFIQAHPELRPYIREVALEQDAALRNLPRNKRRVRVGIGF